MEQQLSLLAFKGSISEAIIEAKQQKKLFVVYVSGQDGAAISMEQSTSLALNEEDSVTKYCILLHLVQGSTEASQFSAIYPQKSIPCLTIIGYNGVMLSQHEGGISYENMVATIKQSWVSLQIQETTATLLTAALASKKSEPLDSNPSNAVTPIEQGSSSNSDINSSSKDKAPQATEDQQLPVPNVADKNQGCETSIEREDVSAQPIHKDEVESTISGISASPCVAVEEVRGPGTVNLDKPGDQMKSSNVGGGGPGTVNLDKPGDQMKSSNVGGESIVLEENKKLNERDHESLPVGSGISVGVSENSAHDKKNDSVDNLIDTRKSNDVHLNIRLPNGASLQKKFSVTDTLRSVKHYVDENQTTVVGLYDLAVPYPRKIFNDQDLGKELSELGLFNRQALVVVPRNPASGLTKGSSSVSQQTNSGSGIDPSSVTNGGYFGRVKRILSFVNPFSYLGSSSTSSSSEQGSNDGLWQYRPNPNLQSHLSTERTNTSTTENSTNKKSRKPTFGSNIHTLHSHRDDEGPPQDRNTFWNGNSTEYGGNKDDK